MLDNFSSYLRSFKDNQNQLLVEMSNQQHYKAKGRLPYSSQLIRLAMLVRYTSFQAYELLQEHFPLPSLALLSKLRKGSIDALKVCSYLRGSGKISQDIKLLWLTRCIFVNVRSTAKESSLVVMKEIFTKASLYS